MNNNPNVFVNSTIDGVARVRNGGYAFILESTTNDYLRSKDCGLIQIGGLLDDKGFIAKLKFISFISFNIITMRIRELHTK